MMTMQDNNTRSFRRMWITYIVKNQGCRIVYLSIWNSIKNESLSIPLI